MSVKMVFAIEIILTLILLSFGVYDYIVNKKAIKEINERYQNKEPSPFMPYNKPESDESSTNTAALGFTAAQI